MMELMDRRARKSQQSSAASSSTASGPSTILTDDELYSPLVTSVKHLLQPNGSIHGQAVADRVLPLFPSLYSAIPSSPQQQQQQQQQTPKPALASIDGRQPLSLDRIRDFILRELGPTLHDLGYGRGSRIAVVLPNGPELAMAILGFANWASCVPLNASGSQAELEADLKRCGAHLVVGPATMEEQKAAAKRANYQNRHHHYHQYEDEVTRNFHVMPKDARKEYWTFDHVQESAKKLDIPFVGLIPSRKEAGIFTLIKPKITVAASKPIYSGNGSSKPFVKPPKPDFTPPVAAAGISMFHHTMEADRSAGGRSPETTSIRKKKAAFKDSSPLFLANSHSDEVLVLFTSGTTGNKKIVPHCLGDMLVASATIALSWNLTAVEVNCNLMPLFHVGGIVRQVFSPILSGGCVICCPSFDPALFWSLLANKAFTWYYAAPTMHQLILHTGKELVSSPANNTTSGQSVPLASTMDCRLRMIANAAGGLLPSLARELQRVFSANVLPSYGMTECMPISSPPHTYQLEKPGTSGVPVGPEVAILNLSTYHKLDPGTEGPICVRGAPCFRGYGINESEPSQITGADSFLRDGWFNTGDLGYMDSDGYLYITGRSKEVINRGGEIISPMEVEEAILSHPDVRACAAFSTPHNVLQEVVGIVIVMADHSRPRFDLSTLHAYLGDNRLAAPKWPQCLVFMDDLPKSHTNKLLRVKLGQRLGLPEVNDALYPIQRTFQAKCPPKGTPIQNLIPCEQVKVSALEVQRILQQELVTQKNPNSQVLVVPHPSRVGFLVCHVYQLERLDAIKAAQTKLHKYCMPSHFCLLVKQATDPKDLLWPKEADATSFLLQGPAAMSPVDPLVREMQEMFQMLLDLDCLPAADTNFFNLGGSSLLASQMASRIRKKHDIPFSGTEVFHHTSSRQIAQLIQERSDSTSQRSSEYMESYGDSSSAQGASSSRSSFFHKNIDTQNAPFPAKRLEPVESYCAWFTQLLPLGLVLPIYQVSRLFLLFMFLLATVRGLPGKRNIWTFVVTVMIFHFIWLVVTPLIYIAIKWIVIGRYKEGRYPIWGQYYLRWWFVEMCKKIIGRGMWGSTKEMLNIYYRMLGAKIGKGARISLEAYIGEYDLVTIGEHASIEYAVVRGFGLDNGAMILGPVGVGDHASVGHKSVVAPYTSVGDNCHLAPSSASYEKGEAVLDIKHKRINRHALPELSLSTFMFAASPITFILDCISQVPAFLVLYWMFRMKSKQDNHFDTMSDMMEWLCDLRRIPFYLGIRVARAIFSPLLYMACAIIVKNVFIGKFVPGKRDTTSQWQLLRHYLVATMFSRENMQEVADIVGRHYQLVSVLFRLCGAKVGKRVFWPGMLPIVSGEFDLLEIGDDVVFGSRSVIFMLTEDSCEKVTLCAGSNVSDNCIVLPGACLGKNAVLASNAVCPEGRYLPANSLWFGSRDGEPVMLEKGTDEDQDGKPLWTKDLKAEQMTLEGDESTLRPFGKAYYNGEAQYWMHPLWLIITFTIIYMTFVAAFHTFPVIGAVHAAALILWGMPISERLYDEVHYATPTVYITILFCFLFTNAVRTFGWVGIEAGTKWLILGRREEGRHNWDSDSYAQNWKYHQLIQRIRYFERLNLLDLIAGSPFIVDFFRLQGCKIGKGCCLYATGGDPYMSEPDMVEMGDRVCVDCSSMVSHLNTRGNCELVKIHMESHTTLRNRARIQQGVYMEAGSMVLEKGLAMTGEIIESDTVWVGAPAARLFTYETTNTILPSTSYVSTDQIVEGIRDADLV